MQMKKILIKILKYFGYVVLSGLFFLVVCYFYYSPEKNPVFGVNFSPDQARYMGYDPREVYQDILKDLKPKKVRLVAHWENIEPSRGTYGFYETDELLKLSEEAGVKVTLVLGHKQPRWPECHHPGWYERLSREEQRTTLLAFVKASAEHFKNFNAVERWQVENEPFFNYGANCPVISFQDLKEEILLVKSLDQRPVVATDSGEKGGWLSAFRAADIFGTTMYRKVHNPRWGGDITYPIPPMWYRVRAGMMQIFLGKKPVVGIELQAEPWFSGNVNDFTPLEHLSFFSLQDFQNNVAYAKKTGLSEHLFWGVEWWYRMKENGHPEIWEEARKLF